MSSKLEIEKFCSRLIDVINREVAYEGHSFHVGASIGVALAPEHGGDPRGLLRCADVAMYEAKAAGRNTWRFYLEAMDSHLAEKKLRETELRAALQNGEFELYYQPRFLAQEQTIASAEALIRWNHPRRGLIGPDEFIGLAEESDLIVQIGNWVLREACATAASWPGEVMVSVNVSPAQFMTGDIVWQVREALRLARLDARRLELEVTENVMLNDVDGALRTMTALKELGVRLNMDDFGTGYSSLGYLRTYPFDSIKIDKRFVASMEKTGRDRSIVQAIINLGNALNLRVTAEGVETEGRCTSCATSNATNCKGSCSAGRWMRSACAICWSARRGRPRRHRFPPKAMLRAGLREESEGRTRCLGGPRFSDRPAYGSENAELII